MSATVGIINKAFNLLVEVAASTAEYGNHSVVSSSSIQRLLECFGSITQRLSGSTELLLRENVGIRAELAEMLIVLQFQDRISQILAHVCDNIDALHRHLQESRQTSGQVVAIDVQAWLAGIEVTYATEERRHNHRSGCSTSAEQPEITFDDRLIPGLA